MNMHPTYAYIAQLNNEENEDILFKEVVSCGHSINGSSDSDSEDQVALAITPELADRMAASFNYCLGKSMRELKLKAPRKVIIDQLKSKDQNTVEYYRLYSFLNGVKTDINCIDTDGLIFMIKTRGQEQVLYFELGVLNLDTRKFEPSTVSRFEVDTLSKLNRDHFAALIDRKLISFEHLEATGITRETSVGANVGTFTIS